MPYGFEQAFTIGFVLSAKDLYTAAFAKARSDLDLLARHSADRAAQFERNLRIGKTLMTVGGTIAAYGWTISRVFEDFIARAGESETILAKTLTTIGEQAGITRSQLERAFSHIKTSWGETDEAVSTAILETGGRLGDYRAALAGLEPMVALAKARQIDLATAASLTTTIIATYADEFQNARTTTDRFSAAANILSQLLKNLGADSSGLSSQLGNITLKAKGAGISLSEVAAVISLAGQAGARLRLTSGQLESLLDQLLEMRKYANFRDLFPSYSRSGSFIDALTDLDSLLARIPEKTDRLIYLRRLFGDNANTVLYFVENLEKLRAEKKTFTDLSRDTSRTSKVYSDAAKNLTTWSETQKVFNAQILEFKEALGAGAIPVVQRFLKTLGSLTTTVRKDPFLRSLFLGGFTFAGLIAELAKITGPIITAIGLWKVYHTQQLLAITLQKRLTQAAIETASVQAGGTTIAGATRTILPAALPAVVGKAGPAAAVLTTAMAAGYMTWYESREALRHRYRQRLAGLAETMRTGTPEQKAEAYRKFLGRPPRAISISNLNITIQSTGNPRQDGRRAGIAAYEELQKEFQRQSQRLP